MASFSYNTCSDDGYPIIRHEFKTLGGTSADSRCANPWHPNHPGPCPACSSTGHHQQPEPYTFGQREAVCANRNCRYTWTPDVPRAQG